MKNCSSHKKDLFGETDMKVVAEMIGDLSYPTLDELLDNLAVKLHCDGIKDFNAGKRKLGVALSNTALYIQKSRGFMEEAVKISKPFMENNNQVNIAKK